jgi:trk system potassium uptake protein TrkH
MFLIVEWEGALRGLAVADKFHNAWFQSATLRTAGFNSVDVAAVHPASYVLMLAFMFIGASPGGTAGGVKTTTVAVLLLAVVHTIRGAPHTTVLARRIPDRTVQRAAVVVTVAAATACLGLLGLLLTQRIPLPVAVFEIVSALGTVGLSQGGTALLDDVGKLIVIACMFAGRIGGLSIMMFMSQRVRTGRVTLPTEDLDVG